MLRRGDGPAGGTSELKWKHDVSHRQKQQQVVWEKKKPTMRQSNCVSFAVWKYQAEHMNHCWSETQVIWSTDTDSAWGLCYCLTFTQWYFPVNIGCKLLLLSQHANLFWVFCFFLSWEACCVVRELSLVFYMMGAYELRYKYFMNVLNSCCHHLSWDWCFLEALYCREQCLLILIS